MTTDGSASASSPGYRGRFAPSPTGPLHFGSLVAALASYLRARTNRGRWLVRIEDLDPPREVPGAADDILRTLEALGLQWDEAVMYQSTRSEAYQAALDALREQGRAYPCACTRSEIAALRNTSAGGEPIYPGTCRNGLPPGRRARAWRVLTTGEPLQFVDAVQGPQAQCLSQVCGDFVIRRADRLFAYQLAVVVDDAEQDITEVVRGCDLLDSTPRQMHLQRLLNLATPSYLHVPVALDDRGEKLSKQTGARPLDRRQGGLALWQALDFLGQQPPPALCGAPATEVLRWALAHWRSGAVPAVRGRAQRPE